MTQTTAMGGHPLTSPGNGDARPGSDGNNIATPRSLAGDGLADAFGTLSDELENRPEIAAAIAAGLGLLLGLALGRPSRAIVYLRD
jgi:hypothetical protein